MKSEGSNDIEKVLIENSTAVGYFSLSDIFFILKQEWE